VAPAPFASFRLFRCSLNCIFPRPIEPLITLLRPIARSIAILALSIHAPRSLAAETASQPARPNIIAILVDDIGVGDFGFTGGKDFPTPHIDALAKDGCIFTNGYVLPSCSPTRAALMTGRYPSRFGIEDNRPLDGPRDGMDTSQVTLPTKLREAGYHTALIGKWHLGEGDRSQFAPRNRGFDEFFGYFGAAGKYVEPVLSRNGKEEVRPGYLTDLLTDEACAFLKRQHPGKDNAKDKEQPKPFFLHLAHMAAHLPQVAKPDDLARVSKDNPQLTGKRRTCAAIIRNLDDNIGRLMATLKDTGLDEKTLVFFLSDNGGEPPVLATTNGPHRGMKFDVLEGGIRVPFVVRWPGHIPAGKTFDPMVHVMDLFPTSLAAAGAPIPQNLDGVDLLPFLTNHTTPTTTTAPGTNTAANESENESEGSPQAKAKTKVPANTQTQTQTPAPAVPHARLCWIYNDHKEWRIPGRDTNLARPLRAIREGNWKLVIEGNHPPELYALDTDPGEARNLAADHPDLVTRLQQEFQKWKAGMKPQLIPDDHPMYGKYKTMKEKR
jgi:arylsulfatase A-like enzyme